MGTNEQMKSLFEKRKNDFYKLFNYAILAIVVGAVAIALITFMPFAKRGDVGIEGYLKQNYISNSCEDFEKVEKIFETEEELYELIISELTSKEIEELELGTLFDAEDDSFWALVEAELKLTGDKLDKEHREAIANLYQTRDKGYALYNLGDMTGGSGLSSMSSLPKISKYILLIGGIGSVVWAIIECVSFGVNRERNAFIRFEKIYTKTDNVVTTRTGQSSYFYAPFLGAISLSLSFLLPNLIISNLSISIISSGVIAVIVAVALWIIASAIFSVKRKNLQYEILKSKYDEKEEEKKEIEKEEVKELPNP